MDRSVDRPERLLRAKAVQERLGCGPTKFYELRQNGEFPPGLSVGTGVYWREHDVDEWIRNRPVADLRKPGKPSNDQRGLAA